MTIEEAVENIREAILELGEILVNKIRNATNSFKESFKILTRTYRAYKIYPNKKIVHLARYGKNKRIRKKNHDKIMRWYSNYIAELAIEQEIEQ